MAAESASEDWLTEEDDYASTDALEEVISSRSAPVEDEAGVLGDEDNQPDRTNITTTQEEDATTSAPTSEDLEFLQRTTEEEETGYEAGEDEEQALELEEEDDRGEEEETVEEEHFDSQEDTVSGSEGESMSDIEPSELVETTTTAAGEVLPAKEGEGEEAAVVTQRDEEIENYQSTVKELSAALIERGEKIGAHYLEWHCITKIL